jgi:hypothetical protein
MEPTSSEKMLEEHSENLRVRREREEIAENNLSSTSRKNHRRNMERYKKAKRVSHCRSWYYRARSLVRPQRAAVTRNSSKHD